MKNQNEKLDTKLNNLKPGQTLILGDTSNEVWTTAERSGNGKRLVFVRHTESTYKVFKDVTFAITQVY